MYSYLYSVKDIPYLMRYGYYGTGRYQQVPYLGYRKIQTHLFNLASLGDSESYVI